MTEVITIDNILAIIPTDIVMYQNIVDETLRASKCYGSNDIVLNILNRELRRCNYNIGSNLYNEYEIKFRHLRKHLSSSAYNDKVKEFLESL